MRLEDKTALVTGGRLGIGRAIVDEFVSQGAQVITCGRGPRPNGLPENINWQTTDVSQREDIESLKNVVVERFSQLDVLVNNAGIQIEKSTVDTTDEDWDALMDVNAKGVFLSLPCVYPCYVERWIYHQYWFYFRQRF